MFDCMKLCTIFFPGRIITQMLAVDSAMSPVPFQKSPDFFQVFTKSAVLRTGIAEPDLSDLLIIQIVLPVCNLRQLDFISAVS